LTGVVAVLVLVLVSTGCGRGAGATEARADVPRASATGSSPTAAVEGIDAFGTDLYRGLVAKGGNLVFSPYSVEIALAMARNGAKGQTRSQMDAVIHGGSGDDIDKSFNLLDQELSTRPGSKGDKNRNGDVELAMANALWGQKDTTFERPFLEVLAQHYGAGMKLEDYKTAAEAARSDINAWASDRTKGKIVDLLPKGSLDEMTRLVLTNAIYFKAPWVKKFSPMPGLAFTEADGSVIRVDGMTTNKVGTFGKGPGWKAGEIPYLGGELSMVVIVPDDLASFEKSLDGKMLASIVGGLHDQLATVQMPKFSFRTTASLKDQLSSLGMPLAFTDQADFHGITTQEQLKISDVYHQAFIAVDEEGTEAAAASAVVFEAVSGPIGETLTVDRPFLFAIRDVKTGAILFLGRVVDPTAR
jgi:serpin B